METVLRAKGSVNALPDYARKKLIKNFTCIGLPYHGLVNNDILKLPNTQSIRYPGITNGDTQLVAIPHYPNITRTPEQQEFDRKKGLQLRNYALVTDNRLGGVDIGPDWLLYIDGDQVVWYLKLGYGVIGNQWIKKGSGLRYCVIPKLNINLMSLYKSVIIARKLFVHFPGALYYSIERNNVRFHLLLKICLECRNFNKIP